MLLYYEIKTIYTKLQNLFRSMNSMTFAGINVSINQEVNWMAVQKPVYIIV